MLSDDKTRDLVVEKLKRCHCEKSRSFYFKNLTIGKVNWLVNLIWIHHLRLLLERLILDCHLSPLFRRKLLYLNWPVMAFPWLYDLVLLELHWLLKPILHWHRLKHFYFHTWKINIKLQLINSTPRKLIYE